MPFVCTHLLPLLTMFSMVHADMPSAVPGRLPQARRRGQGQGLVREERPVGCVTRTPCTCLSVSPPPIQLGATGRLGAPPVCTALLTHTSGLAAALLTSAALGLSATPPIATRAQSPFMD